MTEEVEHDAENIDWDKWARCDSWRSSQAIPLVFGKAPAKSEEEFIMVLNDLSRSRKRDFSRFRQLLKQALELPSVERPFKAWVSRFDEVCLRLPQVNEHPVSVIPREFVQWYANKGFEVPDGLKPLLEEKTVKQVIPEDWLTVSDAARLYVHEMEDTVPFSTAKSRISKKCNNGKIHCKGKGSARRVQPDSLNTFILCCRDKALLQPEED